MYIYLDFSCWLWYNNLVVDTAVLGGQHMVSAQFDSNTIIRIAEMGQQHYRRHRQLVANALWMLLCLATGVSVIIATFFWPPMAHIRIPVILLAAPLGCLIAQRMQLSNRLNNLLLELDADLDKVVSITAIKRNFRSHSFTILFGDSRCDISESLVSPSTIARFIDYLCWRHQPIKYS